MKRYQVVTHSFDIGTDEQMDYCNFSEAVASARKFLGLEEYAAVYDRAKQIAYVIFGNPETHVFCDRVTVQEF